MRIPFGFSIRAFATRRQRRIHFPHVLRLAVAGLTFWQTAAFADIIVESTDPVAYFGTATLLAPGGGVLFSQNYLFLTQLMSPDLSGQIQVDPNTNAYPILQNNIAQFGTLDFTEYLVEIFNTYSGGTFDGHSEPFYNPNDPLTFFPADANLTQALHNLPVPPGTTAQTLTDTGDVLRGSAQYVVSAPTPSGPDSIIQASINLDIFEHDYTAVAQPTAVPEPGSLWLLLASGVALACGRRNLKEKL
jgi:hypothetical protein